MESNIKSIIEAVRVYEGYTFATQEQWNKAEEYLKSINPKYLHLIRTINE